MPRSNDSTLRRPESPGSTDKHLRKDNLNIMGAPTLDQQILLFETIVEGIDKYITTDTRLGGLVYTPQALKAVFTDAVSAITKTRELDEEYRVSVAKQHAAQEKAMAVELLLRDNLVSAYGDEAFEACSGASG